MAPFLMLARTLDTMLLTLRAEVSSILLETSARRVDVAKSNDTFHYAKATGHQSVGITNENGTRFSY